MVIDELIIKGKGTKSRLVKERWMAFKGNKLAVIFIEDNNQTENLPYLIDNYLDRVMEGINICNKVLDLNKTKIYLSSCYKMYYDKLAATGYDVVLVDVPKEFEKIVFDGDTLAHHPETLRQIAMEEKGVERTRILTLAGDVISGGVYEVPINSSIRDVIIKMGGGVRNNSTIKFVQVGGNMGSVLMPKELDCLYDFNVIQKYGTMLSTAKIEVFVEGTCVVDWIVKKMLSLSKKSCGQCVYCREGIYQYYKILLDATQSKSKESDLALIQEISDSMAIGSMCDFGKSVSNPLLTLLEKFGEEIEKHMESNSCPSLVCKEYIKLYIDPEVCIGCHNCEPVCPENAIAGDNGQIHIIDVKVCEKCGVCKDICKVGAIKKYGKVRPKLPQEPIAVGSFGIGGTNGLRRRRRRKSQ